MSAWLVPFMTSTLQVFRPWLMQRLFEVLYLESQLTGKPIMYLLHPEDLLMREGKLGRMPFRWRYLWPSKEHGFLWRFWLYEKDWRVVARQSRELIRRMHHAPSMQSMTVSTYARQLEQSRGGR